MQTTSPGNIKTRELRRDLTLAEVMRRRRGVCAHPATRRAVVTHPVDGAEFLFFCLECGTSATEQQVIETKEEST
jgi:hypothetical protein